MTRFPEGFVWGAATAAHQVEGGNWNNDWWAWEHAPGTPCVEPSGDACDHYRRYPEDIRLLADLGFGAYRFSLEWSRIEPEEGEWSPAGLDHYRRVAETCRDFGLEPIVTLHHFTTPRWAAASGGWAEPATARRFARFAERSAAALSGLVQRFCTINEPNVVARKGYREGRFPPGERDEGLWQRATAVLVDAHRRGVEAIKSVAPDCSVGLTLAMPEYQAASGGEDALRSLVEIDQDPYLEAASSDDFIGVQTYTREIIGPDGPMPPPPGSELTLMGWEYRPRALGTAIRRAHAAGGVPVLVTENGIATADDARRIDFVRTALHEVASCIEDGLPVLGYVYWTALDNFEWADGYAPTFGVIAVDRRTQRRTVKPSGEWLGAVAAANGLPG